MEASSSSSCTIEGNTGIVFFDLETNVPNRAGQRFWVLEFGSIVVCPHKLIELESFTTLIKPKDLSVVALRSGRFGGITRDAIVDAPEFEQVAEKIYSILHGRIWAGHNIQRFDCIRIKEAFTEIGKPAPVPVGIIDSLGVLTEKFGRRAGNMKMASLATYFGLGEQKTQVLLILCKHNFCLVSKEKNYLDWLMITPRSLDDVRMNLEVLKHCATVLFCLPSVLSGKWPQQSSPRMTTRSSSRNNAIGRLPCRSEEAMTRKSPSTSLGYQRSVPYTRGSLGDRKCEESIV
ncbi:protein NEN4 isoform X2 [Carica papaya]|uniref:protein NEN4 isoform X2 n=1 Tax=Carica papaya TaxID=3649 RepID=UPI000B8CA7BA|nr:protein NEN4 isoform X2 [Carica papaya]